MKNFNAFNKEGWFQTGKGEVVTVWSAHHVDATGVNLTRAELVSEGYLQSSTLSASNSIEINGVTYTTNAAYDDALYAQQNLDNMVAALAVYANPAAVWVEGGTTGIATASTPTADFATDFLGASDNFGSELTESTGPVWKVQMFFEQKGVFVDRTTFTKGEPTIGDAADNYGSDQADVHALLEGVAVTATSVDVANMVDVATSSTNTFAAAGDEGTVVSAGNGDAATSQSVVVDVAVAPNLQS